MIVRDYTNIENTLNHLKLLEIHLEESQKKQTPIKYRLHDIIMTNSELRKFFGDKNNWKYKKYVREIPQLLEEYA